MDLRRRLAQCVLALAVVGTAVALVPAGPAHAIPNPAPVSATSVADSNDKSVTVSCPAGQKVYGAGASINAGNGNVVLDEFVPNNALTSVTAQGLEVAAGFGGTWSVTAWAVCGPGTLNQQRVDFQSSQNSTSPKNAIVTCPAGTVVYGLGAELVNAQGNVVLDDLEMDAALSQVNVGGYEISGWIGNWAIKGFAICANPPANGGTITRVSSSSASDGTSPKTESVVCPAGTKLHGMGGELSGALGNVIFDDLTPSSNLSTATAKGFEVGGSSGVTWSIATYGVCAQ